MGFECTSSTVHHDELSNDQQLSKLGEERPLTPLFETDVLPTVLSELHECEGYDCTSLSLLMGEGREKGGPRRNKTLWGGNTEILL